MSFYEDDLDSLDDLTPVHLWEYLQADCGGRWEELARRLALPQKELEDALDRWPLPAVAGSRLRRLLARRNSLTVCALTQRPTCPLGCQLMGGDLRHYRLSRRPPVTQKHLASEWRVTQQDISAAECSPHSPLSAKLERELRRALNRR
jgi:hypothetical protein